MSGAPSPNVALDRVVIKGQPFLKWPGGKRWLVRRGVAAPRLTANATYWEPFLGGGSLYFTGHFDRAVLSDVNPALMTAYRGVKRYPEAVIAKLSCLANDQETFTRLAQSQPRHVVDQTVRFLYLNRTAFGGVYRVNRRGQFNVPFASYTDRRICQPERIRSAAIALKSAELLTSPAEAVLRRVKSGDFVFLDPPYLTGQVQSGFIRYNERLFTWSSQLELAKAAHDLADRGVHVLITNAAHPAIEALYPGFNIVEVKRRSHVATSALGRRDTTEFVISTYAGAVAE